MKLISEEQLPKEQRASCTTEEALSCLEALERQVKMMLEDPLYKMYESNCQKIETLTESLDKMEIKIDSEEKDFDRWLKFIEKSKAIAEGQIFLKDNSTISEVISKGGSKTGARRGLKN